MKYSEALKLGWTKLGFASEAWYRGELDEELTPPAADEARSACAIGAIAYVMNTSPGEITTVLKKLGIDVDELISENDKHSSKETALPAILKILGDH